MRSSGQKARDLTVTSRRVAIARHVDAGAGRRHWEDVVASGCRLFATNPRGHASPVEGVATAAVEE
ncbi:hypothetical protein [Halobellus rarus]|uniref:Uncharacterized protein n=1 Tax=Halobellus rarus TaxID=1126237 RepID=A0ABD6CMV9_9EURY|nr:hypothetical protein [Halobellus rarus]